MLHQDPLDFPPLRVLDNFLLDGKTAWSKTGGRARRPPPPVRPIRFDIDPDTLVSSLTVGERQQLEIMRLLSQGARILVFDEPTTGISLPQKVKLFETLRRLCAEGMTIIFVTHKLEDAEALCDRVTVLRRGQLTGEVARPFTAQQLVQLMFGQALAAHTRAAVELGPPVLELKEACVADYRLRVPDINLQVRAGEVIGLAGIEGSGQRLVLRACAGLDSLVNGALMLAGERMTGQSYRKFLERGVAYLPAGRLEEGLVPGLDLTEHFILAGQKKDVFINWSAAQHQARQRIQEYSIRGAPGDASRSIVRRQSTARAVVPAAAGADPALARASHPRARHRVHHVDLEPAAGPAE